MKKFTVLRFNLLEVTHISRRYNYRAEVYTKEQLLKCISDSDIEFIYVPVFLLLLYEVAEKSRIIINPPVFLGGDEEKIAAELKLLKEKGYNSAQAHTSGHIELIQTAGLIPHGSFRLNVTNSLSLNEYEKMGLADCTLSFELRINQAAEIAEKSGIPTGIIAYGRLPFMITRRCPVSDGKTCGNNKHCGKAVHDRYGNTLPLICSNTVEILNPDILILSDKSCELLKFNYIILRFTDEVNIDEIKSLYEMNVKPDGKYTRGLYYRGVQ